MSEVIEIKQKNELPEESFPPARPNRSDTIAYIITAVIFFALGLLVGYVINMDNGDESSVSADIDTVAEAVQGTMIALTPTATPPPTVVPVQLTYSEKDYRRGDPNAPIKMVEFSDYQCPYCARFAQETLNPLLEMYDGYIEFVYRDYPIFGEPSLQAAHGAYCASEQDKFWEYHDLIFISQEARTPLNTDTLTGFAQELDLDMGTFGTCLNDGTKLDALVANIIDAQSLMGQTGTPTFLINGRRVVGAQPLENFIQIINEELEALGIEPPVS